MVGFVAAHTGTITVHSWWLYHNDPSTLCYAFSKSVYLFIYLKKFWFVHKYPIVLCRLRMSMDHLEVIMCIYITCLIQSGNTLGIMSSCTSNSNPNKYLKPTFFFLYSLCTLSPMFNPHCWFMLLLSYTTDGAAVENLENGSLQGCGVYTGVSNQ